MNRLKNILIGVMTVLMMSVFTCTSLYADERIPVTAAGEKITSRQTASAGNLSSTYQKTAEESEGYDPSGEYFAEDVSLDDANEILQKKGFQLYQLVRTGAMYMLGGIFIISAVFAAYGAISRKATVMPGLAGMIVTGLAFAAVFYATDILAWFTRWISSK